MKIFSTWFKKLFKSEKAQITSVKIKPKIYEKQGEQGIKLFRRNRQIERRRIRKEQRLIRSY